MGTPLVGRLLGAGREVVVHSRRRVSAVAAEEAGATWAASPGDVAAAVDAVVLCLPAGPEVTAVVTGEDGLLAGARPGFLVIDTSTTDPATARALAARCAEAEVAFVDAPVSGGPGGVAGGTLSVMAGGTPSAVARAAEVLAPVTGRLVATGPSGTGQVTKACNQLVVGATIEVVAETLALAEAAGVDPALVRDALLGGYAASRVLELHGRRMIEADYEPGGRAATQLKDLDIVMEVAAETGLELPVARVVTDLYRQFVADGHGDLDHSAIRLRLAAG
jgi:2-hydroxy-3-oxopropionate reductase